MDIVAGLPFELLALIWLGIPVTAGGDATPLWQLLFHFLRFTHAIRLLRVKDFFDRWKNELDIKALKVRLLYTCGLLLACLHGFSCSWVFLGCGRHVCADS